MIRATEEMITAARTEYDRSEDMAQALTAGLGVLLVDEAKLAEILEAHTPALDQTACYMGHCDCMEHVPEYEFYSHVAEKVAVWLRGGGQ